MDPTHGSRAAISRWCEPGSTTRLTAPGRKHSVNTRCRAAVAAAPRGPSRITCGRPARHADAAAIIMGADRALCTEAGTRRRVCSNWSRYAPASAASDRCARQRRFQAVTDPAAGSAPS